HRLRRHGRVLIEDVVRPVAGVVQLKVRAAVGVLVDARDLERTTDCPAERVLRELRLRRRDRGVDLIRRGIQRRAAERVRRVALIRALRARATAAEKKSTAAAAGTAARAAASAAADLPGP